MKLGKIRDVVKKVIDGRDDGSSEHSSEWWSLEIKRLPKEVLNDWFQKRYNENLDYDQWVGIQEVLDGMGRTLYERALTILGDAVFIVRQEDHKQIAELERCLKEVTEKLEETEEKLSKYE